MLSPPPDLAASLLQLRKRSAACLQLELGLEVAVQQVVLREWPLLGTQVESLMVGCLVAGQAESLLEECLEAGQVETLLVGCLMGIPVESLLVECLEGI